MAEELGLQGLVIPEEHGGSGASFVELAVVQEEFGRAIFPGPFLSTLFATYAILDSGDDEAAKDLLPGIADGSTIATVAVTEPDGRWDVETTSTTARPASMLPATLTPGAAVLPHHSTQWSPVQAAERPCRSTA